MPLRVGIGQDSHAFESKESRKKLILGGIIFEGEVGLKADSDGDLVLHAIGRALDSIIGKNCWAEQADKLCLEQGIKDSKEYLKPALQELKKRGFNITSVSVMLECKKPRIMVRVEEMRKSIARILKIEKERIGIVAETGDGLTEFAKGKGIRATATISVIHNKLSGLVV